HQFIAGNKDVKRSESEVILSVGGSEIIDVDLLKKFDYVALGHIHACQKIKYDHIRYSGSLMKYSFDEVDQIKGMVEVTINHKQVNTQIVSLKPKKDLIKVTGKYEDIMDYPDNHDDFVSVELLDKQIIGHAFERLKNKYPDLLQITYSLLDDLSSSKQTTASMNVEKQTPIELFIEFYEKMKGEKPQKEDIDIIEKLLKKDDENDAT
ncbi:MAG: exonuclease SbcCD subunit D, partial [Faecalibacillus sp.]